MVLNWLQTSGRVELVHVVMRQTSQARVPANHRTCIAAGKRFHRTLISIIRRMIDEHQRDRDSLLPYVMTAYRSSRHEATQYTPNFSMMGREVHAPVDIAYASPETKKPSSYDDYADKLQR